MNISTAIRSLIPKLFRWGLISRWLIALCLWAASIQMEYPVVGMWDAVGSITVLVLALCMLVLILRFAARLSPQNRILEICRPLFHLADVVALLFILGCVGLYLNGSLDQSPPEQVKVTILAVMEEPLRLGSWLGAGQTRVRLHTPNSSERTIQLNGRMLNILLPDQVFAIPVHSGFLGFPWTELNGFSHDAPGTLALIQDKTPEDLVLRKRRIGHALNGPQSASGYAEAMRYLQEEDDDLDFALTIAGHAGDPIRGRSDLAIQILKPLIAKHRNYKLYCGFASHLNKVGNTEMSLRYLTAAVEMSPTETEAYYMLGHIFLKAGRREESVAAFKKLIEISPSQEALVRPYM